MQFQSDDSKGLESSESQTGLDIHNGFFSHVPGAWAGMAGELEADPTSLHTASLASQHWLVATGWVREKVGVSHSWEGIFYH